MKKYLKITLIFLIVILVSSLNAYAVETTNSVTLASDKNEVKVGDIVTITISANCEDGIEGINSTLEYNKTKLELQGITVGEKFTNMSGTDDDTGEYKLTVITNSEETLKTENFATLKFKVLDAVEKDEEISVKLSKIELGDSNDKWTTLENQEVKLTVTEETENPEKPGEDEKPGTEDPEKPGENEKPGTEDPEKPGEDEKPGTENPKEPTEEDDKKGTGTVIKDGTRN